MGLRSKDNEDLMRVCEADRQICDILADIEKTAAGGENIQ